MIGVFTENCTEQINEDRYIDIFSNDAGKEFDGIPIFILKNMLMW